MIDILEYEEKLKDESLNASTGKLVNFISKEKKYQFKKESLSFDVSLLETKNVIAVHENHCEVMSSALFFSKFFDHFSKKFNYTLSDGVDQAFEFVKKIEDELKTDGVSQGISAFYRRLYRFLVFLIHKKFGSDFCDYVLTLKKEDQKTNIYKFNSSYSKIICFLNTPVEGIYRNLKHLMDELTDATVNWNSNTGEIRISITKFCQQDPVKGHELFEHALTQPVNAEINSAIIQGLYSVDRNKFWLKIIELCKIPEQRICVLAALFSVPALLQEEAERSFALVSSFEDITEVELSNHPRFYINLLNDGLITDATKESCLAKLEELITHPIQNIRATTILELQFLREYDEQRVNMLRKLLLLDDFNKDHLGPMNLSFIKNNSVVGFMDLMSAYVTKFKVEFNPEVFNSGFYNYQTEQPEELSKQLIKMLTHDQGMVRFGGNRIIVKLTPHNGRFLFQTDILNFDAVTQYKLWMSVLTETKEPKESVPMLLPLLDSKYPFVQETFICKLECLTEEYGASVFETLERELDPSNSHYQTVIKRLKDYN